MQCLPATGLLRSVQIASQGFSFLSTVLVVAKWNKVAKNKSASGLMLLYPRSISKYYHLRIGLLETEQHESGMVDSYLIAGTLHSFS